MKKTLVWGLIALVAALAMSVALGELLVPAEVLALDEEAKTLTIDDLLFELVMDGEGMPLRFEKDGGKIILFARTTEGEIEVLVGTDTEEDALRFVTQAIFAGLADVNVAVRGNVEPLLAAGEAAAALCPQCQKAQSAGDHSLLACGHYRCLAGANHPVVCKYCNAYACNGVDHSAACKVCGYSLCGQDHYDKCINKKAEPKSGGKPDDAKKTESYPGQGQAGPVDAQNGVWFQPMYYYVYAPNANFDAARERQMLKAEINKILEKLERMSYGEKFGKKTAEELREEMEGLQAKLDALNN